MTVSDWPEVTYTIATEDDLDGIDLLRGLGKAVVLGRSRYSKGVAHVTRAVSQDLLDDLGSSGVIELVAEDIRQTMEEGITQRG